MVDVAAGTIAVYGDVACPWAHLATHRLFTARERLGLVERVAFEMRPFPLEIVNERPTPRRTLEAEIPVAGALDPGAGWQTWQAPLYQWPVTTLLALEAIEAANGQSLRAGEQLARALRRAMFGESRCVSMRHVILDVASRCPLVDGRRLEADLDGGTARPALWRHIDTVRSGAVEVSPHLFLPDGSDVKNPGVEFHWERDEGVGFPVVDSDDPSAYDELLQRAADG